MIRVAINGFGRIGRLIARSIFERDNFELVAVNDIIDPKNFAKGVKFLAKLFEWDSVHGRFNGNVHSTESQILINGKRIDVLSFKTLEELPWSKYDVDVVVESTGVFRKKAELLTHIERGAKRVLLSAPPKDDVDMIVKGVNDHLLSSEKKVISNASCTTNCLAPVAMVLHENFGILRGFMSTIHAYTNDQRILDLIHKEDLRRARSAGVNIIPTSTGAAKAIGKVLPALEGKLDGVAFRVPVQDGSMIDLVCELEKIEIKEPKEMIKEINSKMKEASEGKLKGILEYSEEELVSSDIVHNPHSAVFDAHSTMVIPNTKMVKVVAWYDNEWAYSVRCVDLIEMWMKR